METKLIKPSKPNLGRKSDLTSFKDAISQGKESPAVSQDQMEKIGVSEIKYRLLFEHANDAILMVDSETGIILDANRNAELMLGYSREEIISMNRSKLHPPEKEGHYKKQFEDHIKLTSAVDHKSEVINKDGITIPISMSSSVFELDGKKMIMGIFRDISEINKTEEALKESEGIFKSFMRNSPVITYIKDEKLRLLKVSDGFESLLGKPVSELLGKDSYELLPPEFAKSAIADDLKVLEGCKTVVREETLGGRTYKTIKFPIHIEGKPDHIGGFSVDITERKALEEKLRSSEEQFRLMYDLASVGIMTALKDGTFVKVNRSFAEMHGYTIEEMSSLSLSDLDTPESHRLMPERMRQILEGKNMVFEVENYHKDGSIISLEVSASLISYAGNDYIQAFHRDITEKKKLEQQVFFQSNLLENVSDAVIATDNGYNISFWNKAAEKQYGWASAEVMGHPLGEFITNDYLGASLESVLQEISKNGHWKGEVTQNRKDGVRIPIMASLSMIKDGQNQPAGFLAVNRDITERKQMEIALVEKERLSAIGELASGVAHDFNNSLQAILGGLDLLSLNPEELSPEISRRIGIIQKSADDAAVRVQQLQRFAGKGSQSHDHIFVNLNELIDESIEQSRPKWKDEAEKKGLHISIHKNYEEIGSIDGNPGELRSAFYNLIKNAVEAMPEGGKLTFKTGISDEGVYARITDTGMGMSEDTKKRVFQPFYTTKGFELGRGLGMSSVYSIFTEHKGTIRVKKSEIGKGTTMEVILPFGTIKKEKPLEEATSSEGALAGRILWVDDNEPIRDYGQSILEKLGYSPDIVASGEEALKLMESNKYDLVITDIGMPGMSGWQLAEKINENHKGTKIAVLTGWGAEVTDEQKQKHGVGYVIGKPVNRKQIGDLVREAIQLKQ